MTVSHAAFHLLVQAGDEAPGFVRPWFPGGDDLAVNWLVRKSASRRKSRQTS